MRQSRQWTRDHDFFFGFSLSAGQEPTGYVALSLNSAQFFPKSNPNVVLPFLCGTKRVPDTASAAAAAGGADAGGAAAAVGGAAAVAGGAAAAAGGANIAEQHKAVDVRAADITQVGMARKTIGLHPPQCDEGWESFLDKCYKVCFSVYLMILYTHNMF